MLLFSLFSVPLFAVFFMRLTESKVVQWRELGALFLKGALFSLPVLLLCEALGLLVPLSYRPFLLYLHGLLTGHLLRFAAATTGFVLIRGLSQLKKIQSLEVMFFLAGFYTLATVSSVLTHTGPFDVYFLFLLPLLRVSTIVLSAVLIVNLVYAYGAARAACAATLLVIPLLTAAAGAAHASNREILMYLLTLIIVGSASAGWLWLRE